MKKLSLFSACKLACTWTFIVLVFSSTGLSQTVVRGYVMDNVNDIPVEGANIEVEGTLDGTYSNPDGSFMLAIKEQLPAKIVITSLGYELKEINITESSDNLLVSLIPGALVGQKVVVSASRKREKIQEAPSATDLVDEKLIKSDAVVNPFLSLRTKVGLDVIQTGVNNGHITLRGRTSAFQTETFLMADYRNLILPGLGAIGYNQQPIDAIDLEKIEIVKGPGSALYGPGVEAGIVHFISKSPLDLQGTTISLGGGTRNTLQASFRHAGASKDKTFGYKITGYYRRSNDWEIDPSDPEDSTRLASFQPSIISSLTQEEVAPGTPNYNLESYGLVGTLVYKPDDETILTAQGGWSVGKGIFRTSEGEGYSEIPRPFGQLRLQSGGFFGQVFYSLYGGDDGQSYLYTSGLTNIFKGHQFESQLQYNFDFDEERYNFIFGIDYRLNVIDTEETIHGRWEEEDNYTIIGGYTQAEIKLNKKLDFVGATRFDHFVALDEFAFSPRLGLVYKPSPKHTFRLTFNRAFGAPSSINLFADLPLSNRGSFVAQLIGGRTPLTFDNPQTTSFVEGLPNVDGIGMDLQSTYTLLTYQLAQEGVFSEQMYSYLQALGERITGISPGLMSQAPRARDNRLKLSSSDMYEIGYKGLFEDKLRVVIDFYYNKRNNIFSTPFQASPFVMQPTLANDLTQAMLNNIDPEALASLGWTEENLINLYSEVADGLAINQETGAPNLLGLIESDQSPENVETPTLDYTYYNVGELDYFGLDFALKYYFTGDFSAYGSVSWLSQTYFEGLGVGAENTETGIDYSLNIPDLKFKFGLEYYPEVGANGFVSYRQQGDWQSALGLPWTGPVAGFSIVDVGMGYSFPSNLSAHVTVTNLLNEDYRGFFGAPKIGRQLIGKMYYHF